MSRQVKALEEQLRIELFHRHIRSLTLTDKGRELYGAISFALSDLESVIGKLSSSVGQRSISLSTTVSFAALWLLPRLRPAGALHFSPYDQLVQAAVDGHGIAIGRRPLVDGLLKQGRLVELFSYCTVASGSYVLVQNPDACNEFDIAVLTNWLLEQARHPLVSNQDAAGSNVLPLYRVG